MLFRNMLNSAMWSQQCVAPGHQSCWLAAGYFTFWVILSMVWGLIAAVIATLLPIWESKESLIAMCKHLVGRGGPLPSKLHPPLESQDDQKPVQVPEQAVGDDTAHREHQIGNAYKI